MQVLITTCDVCQRQKGETNHWFTAVSDPRVPGPGIAFGTSASFVEDEGIKVEHICGQECLHKRINQWIDACQNTNPATV